MFESHAGKLLIATPRLVDPNFHRSVVLILQHDDDGCVGVVLNRETDQSVADHLPEWAATTGGGVVHFGGPVEPEVAIGLGITAEGLPTGVPGLSMIDFGEPPPTDLSSTVTVYSGYSGWGSRQLESELAGGSWYIVQASPDDPFEEAADQWRRVLRRQPGFLALVSSFPDDIGMN
jgi:putative transcriptional regulator